MISKYKNNNNYIDIYNNNKYDNNSRMKIKII